MTRARRPLAAHPWRSGTRDLDLDLPLRSLTSFLSETPDFPNPAAAYTIQQVASPPGNRGRAGRNL